MADDHDNDNDVTALLTNDHVDKLRDSLRGTNISITRLEDVTRELIKTNNTLIQSNKELTDALSRELLKTNNALIQSNKELAEELRKSRKVRRRTGVAR